MEIIIENRIKTKYLLFFCKVNFTSKKSIYFFDKIKFTSYVNYC